MPTFGYPDISEKFQDNLDLLEVIIQKYYESHQIILVGDMNATLVKSWKNDSDKRCFRVDPAWKLFGLVQIRP